MLRNKEVRVETTSRCNAKCTVCPREKMTRPLADMPLSHFKDLSKQAKELGAEVISLFGYGEPLLDPGIVEKIEFCNRLGLETFITTNASLLTTEKTKAILGAGLTRIRFSVHGQYGNYDNIHKGLNYSTTMRNIRNFNKINKIQYGKNCKTDVTILLMNNEDVDELKAIWGKTVDNIEVWRPHNWTVGRHYRETRRKKKTCGRPFSGPIQIQADGKMIVCCFDFDGVLEMGDTYQESIDSILKGKAFNEIRRKHEDGDLTGLICQTCDQLNEGDNSLLYSSINKGINRTFYTKHNLEEKNGINTNRTI